MRPSEPIDARRGSTTFHLLGGSRDVWFCPDACLELRPARSACSRCREVCPVQAFEWTEQGVGLNARCTGCGWCAASCPSGAIRVAGFEPAKFKSSVQRIECGRVPDHIAGDAAKVPCLGGVASSVVLGLTAAGGTAWRLVDRGWCASCPMGNGQSNVAAASLDLTNSMLAAIGAAPARWPAVVYEPLASDTALPLKAPVNSAGVNRRNFFSALARTAEKPADQKAPVTADGGACQFSPVIQLHRKRFAAAVQTLANEAGGAVPASLFPMLEVAPHCDHQGLCAAVCPSGALRPYQDDANGIAGLQFDAPLCLACGLCARQCPSAAIRLLPIGNETAHAASGAQALTRHDQKVCRECASAYVGAHSGDRCPRCQTDRSLAMSMFGTKLADSPLSD